LAPELALGLAQVLRLVQERVPLVPLVLLVLRVLRVQERVLEQVQVRWLRALLAYRG